MIVASIRREARRCLWCLASFGFSAALVVGCATPCFGESAKPLDPWTAYLRPGCRVIFVLPTTSLSVQTKWLGPITISRLWTSYRGTCPTEPVNVNDVEFG